MSVAETAVVRSGTPLRGPARWGTVVSWVPSAERSFPLPGAPQQISRTRAKITIAVFTAVWQHRLAMRSLRSTRPAARRAHRRGRPLRQSVLSGWTADHYTPAVTRRFLYDTGWNGRAEIDEAGAVVQRGLWGLDVSGSRAGVGGVGGLLAVQMLTGPATGLNYPLYDGNITEYLNAAGTVAAHYKYDPFGCIYASSGALKDAFPYRFSTKRLDPATYAGKTKPVAPNAKPNGTDDPEGRQKNRRVEITVTRQD